MAQENGKDKLTSGQTVGCIAIGCLGLLVLNFLLPFVLWVATGLLGSWS